MENCENAFANPTYTNYQMSQLNQKKFDDLEKLWSFGDTTNADQENSSQNPEHPNENNIAANTVESDKE